MSAEKKKVNDHDLVCYCFEYTKKDIEDDLKNNGHSTVLGKIIAEKKQGRCECATKNPRKR
jgi:hypothetical protein